MRLALAVALLWLAPSVSTAQVFLKAGAQVGQGVLRSRGDDCFILAPAHVVEGADSIQVVAELRRLGHASVETVYPGDLALLRVDRASGLRCSEQWDAAPRLLDRLSTVVDGSLESRNEDGSLERRFVKIVSHDPQFIVIKAVAPNDAFFRGLSGSMLRMGGSPAGLLLRVESATGLGIVLRNDHLTDMLRTFFREEARQTVAPAEIGQALMTLDTSGLRRIIDSHPDVTSMEEGMRWAPVGSESSAIERFLIATKERRSGLNWLDSLISLGLSPDFQFTSAKQSTTLLRAALLGGNVDAALLVLKRGAWPHPYEQLDRGYSGDAMFLHPLEYVAAATMFDRSEKQQLVTALLEAGAILAPPLENEHRILKRLDDINARIGTNAIKSYAACCGQQVDRLCSRSGRLSGSDWCGVLRRVPRVVAVPDTLKVTGIDFAAVQLAYLIGIRGNDMYFMGPERLGSVRYGYDQYAVVRVSRDLTSWTLLQYSESEGSASCPENSIHVGSSFFCWHVVPLTRIGDTDMLEDDIGWRAKFRLGTCVPWGLTAANGLPACGRSGRD
jgi:hypothetical protein